MQEVDEELHHVLFDMYMEDMLEHDSFYDFTMTTPKPLISKFKVILPGDYTCKDRACMFHTLFHLTYLIM